MDKVRNKTISILRWSERYTKTDMVYLFSSSAWVFVGQLATSLSAFVVMVVLANLVSKETLGEYRYIISMISILMIFTLPGLDTALTQSTARGYEGQLDLAVKTKMRWGLLATLVSFLGAGYYFFQGNNSLALSFTIVGLLMPLFGAYFTYFFFLQGRQRFAEASLTQAVGRIVFLVIMIATAYVVPTATALVTAFLVSTIIAQNAGSWWTRRRYPQTDNPDPELIGYGKHLSLLGAAGIVATNIDKVMIWFFLGAVPTAVYTIATLLPLESIRSGRMLAQVVLPRFSSRNNLPPFWATLHKLGMMFIVMFFGWIIYALLAPYFFEIFFPDYMDSVSYSIVAMLIILTTPVYVIRALFTSNKYTKGLNITFIVIPLLKTIVLAIGLFTFGLWGAVWAFVLGGLVEIIISVYLLYRMYYDSNI